MKKYIVPILFCIVLLLASLLAYSKIYSLKIKSGKTQLQKYLVKNVTIKTNLAKKDAEKIAEFLTMSILPDLMPKELNVTLAEKGSDGKGPVYLGTWNKNGRPFSIIYGLSPDEKSPMYLRVWYMPTGTTVDLKSAEALAEDTFADSFGKTIGTLTCNSIKDPGSEKIITDCSAMKTASSEDLLGMTIKAPVPLTLPSASDKILPTGAATPTVIIVSACLIPKDKTQVYPAQYCI